MIIFSLHNLKDLKELGRIVTGKTPSTKNPKHFGGAFQGYMNHIKAKI